MVKAYEEWVEAQGLAAAQDFRRMIQQPGAMLGTELQLLATNIVRVAFNEGLKRGEYKCVDFLNASGEGYRKMGFEKDGIEFVKASKTVKGQLDKKYNSPNPGEEANHAAQSVFRD